MSFSLLALNGKTAEAPTIVQDESDLGDDPNSHRWRAQWDRHYDGTVTGIWLRAYPVVKLTPQGAHIDPDAWREWQTGGRAWHLTGRTRWVSNTGSQAWAKRTQEEALRSIAIRLDRWSRRLYGDMQRIADAAGVLAVLRPDDAWLGREALNHLRLPLTDRYVVQEPPKGETP